MQQLTIRRIGWEERIHRPTEVEEEEACWHATRTGDKKNEHDEQRGIKRGSQPHHQIQDTELGLQVQ